MLLQMEHLLIMLKLPEGGNLNINAGGSSNASIEQNNVSIKGNFNNGAQLKASGN